MEFFIPAAETVEQREGAYAAIKRHLAGGLGAEFSDRQIRVLRWRHDGKEYEAEVGQTTAFNHELVVAILYEPFRDLYHICTPNRGVIRDMSILAGGNSVRGSLDFQAA